MSTSRKRTNLDRVLSSFDDFPRSRPIKRARSDDKVSSFRSPSSSSKSTSNYSHAIESPQLEDIGIVRSLGKSGSGPGTMNACLSDPSAFVRSRLFDAMPLQRAGMNSTRTAEVLNFRANVPPLVTTAHVHALAPPAGGGGGEGDGGPSGAEREIAAAIRAGRLRRVVVPLRGQGTASVSDLLIATVELKRLLRRVGTQAVSEAARDAFVAWLDANPFAAALSSADLPSQHVSALSRAGFLTSAAAAMASSAVAAADGAAGAGSAASSAAAKGSAMSLETIAAAASGTAAAVGGPGGSLAHGGGGAGALQVRPSPAARAAVTYQIAVPNAAAYLKLLVAARAHVVELLKKSSRKELPLYLLKEYWDAGLTTKQATTKVAKNPFDNLLPGQTKKWKAFYGMTFEWAFEEAFGGGLIECFNTRSVGLGVRLV